MKSNILLVEDEDIARLALAKIIEEEGYSIEIAENGSCGLDIFKKKSFDIVITDFRMPKMDGYDVYKKIREIEQKENRKSAPLIILSGQFQIKSINKNNVYFIQKPIDIANLLQKIKKLLKR